MEPLYVEVKKKITQSLILGEWVPGEAIPSEIELANIYDVSQGTVRKAIDDLTAESILVRRQGKGTYVATHNEENIQLRFLRLTSNFGSKEKLDNQLISFSKEKATNKLAKILNINPASTIITLKRKPLINKPEKMSQGRILKEHNRKTTVKVSINCEAKVEKLLRNHKCFPLVSFFQK